MDELEYVSQYSEQSTRYRGIGFGISGEAEILFASNTSRNIVSRPRYESGRSVNLTTDIHLLVVPLSGAVCYGVHLVL
jgi:hypothetical protein